MHDLITNKYTEKSFLCIDKTILFVYNDANNEKTRWERSDKKMQITMQAARMQAGYTQAEAGKLFGVHEQTVGRWEEDSSEMPYNKIAKIPLIYGVSQNEIFFGKKNEFIRFIRETAEQNRAIAK